MRNSSKILYSNETVTFHKGKRAWYCVYSNGTVTRTWLKSLREEKVRIFIHNGKAECKVDSKIYTVKHLVAKYFIANYKKGISVRCIDKNEFNCDVKNLAVYSPKNLGELTGILANRNHPINVVFPNGQTKTFESVRSAAKSLYVSYQTVRNYISGNVKKSVLDGYIISKL